MIPQQPIQEQSESFERYRERLANFSSEFELGLFLFIVRKSYKWILAILATSVIAAWLFIRYSSPLYEASSIIQLGEENSTRKVISGIAELEEEAGSPVDQALELIRSEYLFRRAVNELHMKELFFQEGQVLTENCYPVVPLEFNDLVVLDSAILGTRIDFSLNEKTCSISYTLNGKNFETTAEHGRMIQAPHFRGTLHIIDPAWINEHQQSNKLYFEFFHPEKYIRMWYPQLNVEVVNASARTIRISVRNNNPQLAMDMVGKISSTFNTYALEKKNESSNRILSFISAQIDTVYNKLKTSELELQAFRQINKVQDFQGISENYLQRLTDLEGQMMQVEIEEELLKEVEQAIQHYKSEDDISNVMTIMVGTKYEEALSGLLKELHNLIMSREKEMFSSTSKSTYIKSLDYQIEIQIKLINQAIASIRSQTNKRKGAFGEKIHQYETIYYGLPEKEIVHARMERMFAINEKYHTLLLEKKTEYEISLAGQTPGNQVLEAAQYPMSPISPRKKVIYILFFIFGILSTVIMLFVRYMLHNEITSLHEIQRVSHASIGTLGIIPKYFDHIPVSQLIVDKNPKSLISEAFRTIRTNLQFISNDPNAKLIAITSTVSGEGKTFVAINLGGIIAYSGKRVVIIDLDMRKPKIHLGFETDNEYGMSTLLIGRDTVEKCIRKSSLENLHFITSGPIPPNPAELIINGKLETIIEELKQQYDIVIIDNPPAGLVTDGIPIMSRADFPIYIFRANYSKKNFVQNVDRLMNENKITRLSVILNSVDTSRGTYGYNYGYGYGYGYGYTYGENYYTDEPSEKKKGFLRFLFKKKK
jgi:capsular exopolysaccharide synthesis family protein